MTVLNDKQILELMRSPDGRAAGMIDNYAEKQIRDIDGERIISWGLSSFGYDARLAGEFMLPRGTVLDPKRPGGANWDKCTIGHDDEMIIPPHGFVLARTVERFKMPDDVMAICVGKSTYARNGLIVNVTPLEPGWEGHVTLELSNTTDLPSVVYVGEGICQFIFFRGERPSVTYSDRGGKYMNQSGVTLARV